MLCTSMIGLKPTGGKAASRMLMKLTPDVKGVINT